PSVARIRGAPRFARRSRRLGREDRPGANRDPTPTCQGVAGSVLSAKIISLVGAGANGPGENFRTGRQGGVLMTRIAIYDTTLRDGSQGEGVNFSLQDKLLITAQLDHLGIDYVEGGYPLSNPKDAAYFREVRDLELAHAKVTAFGMTRRRDVAAE